jgi:hypothetical protein
LPLVLNEVVHLSLQTVDELFPTMGDGLFCGGSSGQECHDERPHALPVQTCTEAFYDHPRATSAEALVSAYQDGGVLRFGLEELGNLYVKGARQPLERGYGGGALPSFDATDGVYGQAALLGQGPERKTSSLPQPKKLGADIVLGILAHGPLFSIQGDTVWICTIK